MGFGRILGRAAPQHFSEAEIAQLTQWYHEGAAKKIVKMKGPNAADRLIEMMRATRTSSSSGISMRSG